jgi:RNA-splicing ligase RtcB
MNDEAYAYDDAHDEYHREIRAHAREWVQRGNAIATRAEYDAYIAEMRAANAQAWANMDPEIIEEDFRNAVQSAVKTEADELAMDIESARAECEALVHRAMQYRMRANWAVQSRLMSAARDMAQAGIEWEKQLRKGG